MLRDGFAARTIIGEEVDDVSVVTQGVEEGVEGRVIVAAVSRKGVEQLDVIVVRVTMGS